MLQTFPRATQVDSAKVYEEASCAAATGRNSGGDGGTRGNGDSGAGTGTGSNGTVVVFLVQRHPEAAAAAAPTRRGGGRGERTSPAPEEWRNRRGRCRRRWEPPGPVGKGRVGVGVFGVCGVHVRFILASDEIGAEEVGTGRRRKEQENLHFIMFFLLLQDEFRVDPEPAAAVGSGSDSGAGKRERERERGIN